MSDTSANLQLPYLAPAQAQKHVTVNEALLRLDALTQLTVVSATTPAQPASPSDGAIYILPPGKTGAAWGPMANGALAYWRDGFWEEITPKPGWRAFVQDAGVAVAWAGAAWRSEAPQEDQLINGGFGLWRRGLSFSDVGQGYGPDRWAILQSGTAKNAVSRQLSGLSDAPHCARLARPVGTVGGAALALVQILESTRARALAGRFVSVSLRLRLGATFSGGAPALSLISGTVADEGLAALAAGWTGAATIASSTPAIPADGGFHLVTLSGFVPAGAQELAVKIGFTPNGTAGANDWIEIAAVRLEAGLPSPYAPRPMEVERALAEAYFETTYDDGISPGSASDPGRFAFLVAGAGIASNARLPMAFRSLKRKTPMVALYAPGGSVAGRVGDSGGASRTAAAIAIGQSGFEVQYTDAVAAGGVWFHYTADAEL